jgi:hypothetical protein
MNVSCLPWSFQKNGRRAELFGEYLGVVEVPGSYIIARRAIDPVRVYSLNGGWGLAGSLSPAWLGGKE